MRAWQSRKRTSILDLTSSAHLKISTEFRISSMMTSRAKSSGAKSSSASCEKLAAAADGDRGDRSNRERRGVRKVRNMVRVDNRTALVETVETTRIQGTSRPATAAVISLSKLPHFLILFATSTQRSIQVHDVVPVIYRWLDCPDTHNPWAWGLFRGIDSKWKAGLTSTVTTPRQCRKDSWKSRFLPRRESLNGETVTTLKSSTLNLFVQRQGRDEARGRQGGDSDSAGKCCHHRNHRKTLTELV